MPPRALDLGRAHQGMPPRRPHLSLPPPLRRPAITVTTRHSSSLFPWQCTSQLPQVGIPLGINQLTGGTAFCYDPWHLYEHGLLSSPNMVVLGQLGRGKSALVKTYLSRQLD